MSAEKTWHVDFEKDEALKARVYNLIQAKLSELGGFDPEFMDNIVKIIMININSSMKRSPADVKQDLEDIVEDDNVDKLMEWLKTEFQDAVKEFRSAECASNQIKPVEVPKEQPKPTLSVPPPPPKADKPAPPQENRPDRPPKPSNDPPKNKDSSETPRIEDQKDRIQPENIDGSNRNGEKNSLSKRKPETNRKNEADDKRTIFDRIKPKEGAEQHQGNKRQGPYQPNHQKAPYQQRPFKKGPNGEQDKDGPENEKNGTPEENAERQAKLQQLISKAKKHKRCVYFPHCKNTECDYVHPEENCPWFPKCVYGEGCYYIHPEIFCKYGVHCQRENCAYKHPMSHKFAQMSNPHYYNPHHSKPAYSKKTNPNPTSQSSGNA